MRFLILTAFQRSQRPSFRIALDWLAVLALLIPQPVCAAITFNGPAMVEGKGNRQEGGGCYFATDLIYKSKIEALSDLALGKQRDGTLGCITYPYMAGPYDEDGSLKILNDVHAGIDLRADKGLKVLAIDGGTVVYQNLCVTTDKQISERKCLTKDGKQHSTLIIENAARTHKILYLHLSTHDDAITKNSVVKKGAYLGLSGDVGADAPHLHIEIWASTAPQYCSREKSISGSACPGKPERTLANKTKSTSYCELEDVRMHTVDPAEALEELALSSPMGKTLLSVNTPLLLRSFGPVNVGATAAEAAKAIGSPLIGDVSTEDCGYARPRFGPGGVSFMMIGGRIARIEINSCQLKTRGPPAGTGNDLGAGIGDTEGRVKRLYPGIKVSEHKYDDNGHYLTLVPKDAIDSKYRLIFETDGKVVTKFRAGRIPEVEWVEGCF
jgi:Peptidase family M23